MINELQFEDRTEWLDQRRKGIGGSDVAVLFNKSKWTTETDLIKRKKNPEIKDQGNAITGLGHRMERVIVEDFVEKKYEDVRSYDDTIFVNSEIPLLQASPDAIAKVDGKDVLVEIKFVNLFGGTTWKNEYGEWQLPESYWMQVQHYMGVLNLDRAIVVAFMQELNDTIEFEVAFDSVFFYELRLKAVNFFDKVAAYTGEIEYEVSERDKPIVEEEMKRIKGINKEIAKLTTEKKAIQVKLLDKYDDSAQLQFGALKGIIYQRKTKTGFTRILKVA